MDGADAGGHANGGGGQSKRAAYDGRPARMRAVCVAHVTRVLRRTCSKLRYRSKNMMANASVATHMSGLISRMRPLATMMMQNAMKPRPMPSVME